MSHISTVELEITSLDDLQAACEVIGATFDRQATTYRSFYSDHPTYQGGSEMYQSVISRDRFGVADAGVISVKNASYDVGVYKVPGKDGKYALIYDAFDDGNGLHAALGVGLVKLKERYGATVATRQLKKQGFAVREERHPQTNRLRLVASRSRF